MEAQAQDLDPTEHYLSYWVIPALNTQHREMFN